MFVIPQIWEILIETNTLKFDYTEDSLLDEYEEDNSNDHLSVKKTVENNEVERSRKRLILFIKKTTNKHVWTRSNI